MRAPDVPGMKKKTKKKEKREGKKEKDEGGILISRT